MEQNRTPRLLLIALALLAVSFCATGCHHDEDTGQSATAASAAQNSMNKTASNQVKPQTAPIDHNQ